LNENIDIMLEVKDKEISCIKCINALKQLKENTKDFYILKDEFSKYKLLLLQYDCSVLIKTFNDFSSIIELYNFIDKCKNKSITFENYKLALKTAYKYFNNITTRESSHFNSLINSDDLNMLIKAKAYLKKLCLKYEIQQLVSSYYFSEI
ncbi:MAG: UV DNA damage repair endonuclease UvsE, partial [Sarcina sp.]